MIVDLRDTGGGKIFNDWFSFVDVDEPLIEPGTQGLLNYKGLELGTAEVLAKRSFSTAYLTEVVCAMEAGTVDVKRLAWLKQKLAGQQPQGAHNCMQVVVRYTDRNAGNLKQLIQDWWQSTQNFQS